MDIQLLSNGRYSKTITLAVILSGLVVAAAALLGRATLNMNAALIDKPDLAIYLLLPEEGIGKTTLLRSTETTRDYLAETKEGDKLVQLSNGENGWYVENMEMLHN